MTISDAFLCRADDVQLEFVMLDPYYRLNLAHNNKVSNSLESHAWFYVSVADRGV